MPGIGSAWETQTFLSLAPKDDSGRPILSKAFSEADLKLVAEGVLKQCDSLDGLADRLVMNTAPAISYRNHCSAQAAKKQAASAAST